MKAYLVGGAVRDRLLGLPVKDRDWVVVGASVRDMVDAGFTQVGRDFPVFLHPETHEEYALARTERKQGKGYTGFVVHSAKDVTLEEDLKRRDLTINAMAMDETGQLIDPWQGERDLKEKTLRHVSPMFVEDPLRVLRLARFSARFAHLGFAAHSSTTGLAREIASSGELAELVPERVWQETERALLEKSPQNYISCLRDCGALVEVFPEVDALFGIEQRAEHHPEIDTGLHTLLALEQSARQNSSSAVRWAVLLHDLGKALTPKEELPAHRNHEQRGLAAVEALCARVKCPAYHRQLALKVCGLHLKIHRAFELNPKTVVKLFEEVDLLRRPQMFSDLLAACQADARGRKGREDAPYPQAARLQQLASAYQTVDAGAIAKAVQTSAAKTNNPPGGIKIAESVRRARLNAVKACVKMLEV